MSWRVLALAALAASACARTRRPPVVDDSRTAATPVVYFEYRTVRFDGECFLGGVSRGSTYVSPIWRELRSAGFAVSDRVEEPHDLEMQVSGVFKNCDVGQVTLSVYKGDRFVTLATASVVNRPQSTTAHELVTSLRREKALADALPGKSFLALGPETTVPKSASASAPLKPSPSALAVQQRTSMYIAPLKCMRGASADTCRLIGSYMLSQFQAAGSLRTVGVDDINAVLGVDKQKQAIGCGDVSCMAEIGGALGVDLVMYGELGVLGSKYNINVSAVRTSNASVAARASLRCDKTEDALADNLPTLVRDVVNGINAAPAQ